MTLERNIRFYLSENLKGLFPYLSYARGLPPQSDSDNRAKIPTFIFGFSPALHASCNLQPRQGCSHSGQDIQHSPDSYGEIISLPQASVLSCADCPVARLLRRK